MKMLATVRLIYTLIYRTVHTVFYVTYQTGVESQNTNWNYIIEYSVLCFGVYENVTRYIIKLSGCQCRDSDSFIFFCHNY